jgi:hypothetical protein
MIGDWAAGVVALRRGEISGSFGKALPECEPRHAFYIGCKYRLAVTSGAHSAAAWTRGARWKPSGMNLGENRLQRPGVTRNAPQRYWLASRLSIGIGRHLWRSESLGGDHGLRNEVKY